ncbi:IclR family transcriptional regulator [Microbacterium sp. Se63.02b]|nr:IclR family transcriptional regulator [Microbacterium sp. Se63.02b]
MTDSVAERVAALLLAFETPDGAPRSVSELSRAIGRERSQVSRMLKSLARGGLLEQDEITRTYRLGWRLRVLAASAGNDLLVRASRPVLQRLVAATGEVALLSVQEGNRSLTVHREESQQSLQAGGWVGRRSPLHCTASGRALLLDSDDEHVESLTAPDLATTVGGPAAPRDLPTLLQRLRDDRHRGYSVASEEVEVGLTSISAPVRDRHGRIAGVINVSGPTQRVADRVDSIGDLLLRAAASAMKSFRSSQAS